MAHIIEQRDIEGGRKRLIRYAGYRVVLRLDKDGKDKKWVLTGFLESENRKNPDETAQLVSLERPYAPEAYKFTRHQEGAGFIHLQDKKYVLKREDAADESLLCGVEYIENPSAELRENCAVKPEEIYQMITDMVLNTIEQVGHLPWQKEWEETGMGSGRITTNFVSRKPYRGINAFLLNFEQKIEDGKPILAPQKFTNSYFMNFN